MACDRNELLRRILDEEPVAPRRLNPSIRRDLETIILKAMEKEPSARYGSAQALADDLRRFLDDQPIQARRPSLLDQAVKWSRRHRALVVASIDSDCRDSRGQYCRALGSQSPAHYRSQICVHETVDHSLGTLDQITRPLTGDAGLCGRACGQARASHRDSVLRQSLVKVRRK